MTKDEIRKRKEFLMARIDKIDTCIHELEVTANNYYTQTGKDLKGWNLLLGSRDKLKKLSSKDLIELDKLK
jgi:hypothetical protein